VIRRKYCANALPSPLNAVFLYYLEMFSYALGPWCACRWFLFLNLQSFQEFIPRLWNLLTCNLPSPMALASQKTLFCCCCSKKLTLWKAWFFKLFKSSGCRRRKIHYRTLSASMSPISDFQREKKRMRFNQCCSVVTLDVVHWTLT